jgi:hypothetical protein
MTDALLSRTTAFSSTASVFLDIVETAIRALD